MSNKRANGSSSMRSVVDFAQVIMGYHTNDSREHSQNVRRYTRLLCLKYNNCFPDKAISESDLDMIYQGAILHDIGKISISDSVLQKKAPLTPEEYEMIKQHTINGAQMINRMREICRISDHDADLLSDICLSHHERYDGNGYPNHLKGDEIPLHAQIVGIAEVYDALTADNYHESIPHQKTQAMMTSGECGVINPELMECLKLIEADLNMTLMMSNNDYRMSLLEDAYGKPRSYYWAVKRICDVTVSTLTLTVFSPLLLLIALAIFIDDPHGSPIFKQTRVGRHKKLFTMYKFRTMVVNAEELKAKLMEKNEKDGPAFKMENDPRITRIGRILRKTSLDELPQVVNILRGDMTIVGPRPPLPSEVEQYSRYHEMRLSVTPGLTCIWQIQEKRDSIRFDQWMDMDVVYIGTRSISKDAKIIFKTLQSVLHKSGS